MGFFVIRSRAANSVALGQIRPNFELIQALMHVIVTLKYEKDPIKSIRENVITPFSHYNSMGAICCHGNQSSDPIWIKTY